VLIRRKRNIDRLPASYHVPLATGA